MNTMSLIILTKKYKSKGGGLANADMADKGGRGIREMLTMADKGGRGVWTPPPFLADIICKQPLLNNL